MKLYPVYNNNYFFQNRSKDKTPAFSAIKKTRLAGLSLTCACMFKAPLEKFNSEYDLHDWAEENIQDAFENSTKLNNIPQREQRLDIWKKYLTQSRPISSSAAYVIFSSIIKDLKPDNRKLPPPLNTEVLNNTIHEITDKLSEDSKYTFNFNKLYKKNLNSYYLNNTHNNLDKNNTGWIFIPSQLHDSKDFESNVNNLMLFSYKTWCTTSFNAPLYLAGGDFHIFLEKGNPKAVIRMYDNYIAEIQGVRNDKSIPWQYIDVIETRIKDKELTVPPQIQNAIEKSHQVGEKISLIKEELEPAIKNNDIKAILNYFNMGCKKEDFFTYLVKKFETFRTGQKYTRQYTLKYFREPEDFTLAELGINENNIFKQISEISGDAVLTNSSVSDLGSVEYIGGKLSLNKSPVSHLGRLKVINGKINVKDCPLQKTEHEITINGINIPANTKKEDFPTGVTYL